MRGRCGMLIIGAGLGNTVCKEAQIRVDFMRFLYFHTETIFFSN